MNVNDKPQMAHGKEGGGCLNHGDGKKLCTPSALPLFSFSKPQHVDSSEGVRGTEPVGGPFWDIMYPAWTFWGGGMLPRPCDARGMNRPCQSMHD